MSVWQRVEASPVARPLRSWTWPCLGIAVFLAMPMAVPEPDSGDCARAETALPDGMVCLGDGGVLDPSTSLVWRQAAPGTDCATIDPLKAWRAATSTEQAGIASQLPVAAASADLCVNDSLARIQLPPPAL